MGDIYGRIVFVLGMAAAMGAGIAMPDGVNARAEIKVAQQAAPETDSIRTAPPDSVRERAETLAREASEAFGQITGGDHSKARGDAIAQAGSNAPETGKREPSAPARTVIDDIQAWLAKAERDLNAQVAEKLTTPRGPDPVADAARKLERGRTTKAANASPKPAVNTKAAPVGESGFFGRVGDWLGDIASDYQQQVVTRLAEPTAGGPASRPDPEPAGKAGPQPPVAPVPATAQRPDEAAEQKRAEAAQRADDEAKRIAQLKAAEAQRAEEARALVAAREAAAKADAEAKARAEAKRVADETAKAEVLRREAEARRVEAERKAAEEALRVAELKAVEAKRIEDRKVKAAEEARRAAAEAARLADARVAEEKRLAELKAKADASARRDAELRAAATAKEDAARKDAETRAALAKAAEAARKAATDARAQKQSEARAKSPETAVAVNPERRSATPSETLAVKPAATPRAAGAPEMRDVPGIAREAAAAKGAPAPDPARVATSGERRSRVNAAVPVSASGYARRPRSLPQKHADSPAPRCGRAGRLIMPPGWYVVRAGDSLWRISERHYRDPLRWTGIRAANPAIIRRSVILPCQRIFIPAR